MSSLASRRRQRQRRRAREKLWEAQGQLAERHGDLLAYDRVIADMARRRDAQDLSPTGEQAISTITALRDTTWAECTLLERAVAELTDQCAKLEPQGLPA